MTRISPSLLDAARRSLIGQIEAGVAARNGLVRIAVPVAEINLLNWLRAQQGASRYYWRDRDGSFEMAGLGEADVFVPTDKATPFEVVAAIRARILPGSSSSRYYGGFRFNPGGAAQGDWRDFRPYRFVAPLIELCRDQGQYTLACTIGPNTNPALVVNTLAGLDCSGRTDFPPLPVFHDRTDLPDADGWRVLVEEALANCTAPTGEKRANGCTPLLQKVVIARQTSFHAEEPVDPVALTEALSHHAANAYCFCFQPESHRAFLGISPECLYRRDKRALYSEALAGTRPRGDSHAADHAYEAQLLSCDKENREHRIVVEDICAALKRFCVELRAAPSPVIVKLAHCQHLYTPIEGVLKEGVDDAALIDALHPTPAVGGRPREAALRWLHAHEPFERGIYAAPVGWIGVEGVAFCVGIRSGLVRDKTLILYAGAGIVPGSNAEEEWRELNAKTAGFLQVIMEGLSHGQVESQRTLGDIDC